MSKSDAYNRNLAKRLFNKTKSGKMTCVYFEDFAGTTASFIRAAEEVGFKVVKSDGDAVLIQK